MYGAYRVVGIGPPIELGGRKLSVHARTVRDYAVIESHMVGQRTDPFDVLRWMARNGFGGEDIQTLFQKLRKGWWRVSFGELLSWLQTWNGRVLGLSLATRMDVDWTRRAVMRECRKRHPEGWWSGIQEALDAANGEDELAALRWLFKETENNQKGIHWENVFRVLGEEPFHKSVEEISGMTLGQISIYWGKREQEMDEFEADARLQKLRDIDEKAVLNLTAGKRWDA